MTEAMRDVLHKIDSSKNAGRAADQGSRDGNRSNEGPESHQIRTD
jgi:hypothetical protein